MKTSLKNKIIFSLCLGFLGTLCLVKPGFGKVAGEIIISSERDAFLSLAYGYTNWPIYKIEDNKINVDGKIDELEWNIAHKIFLTGNSRFNLGYLQQPQLWTGLEDLLAVWRVLYDNNNLYVSVLFVDSSNIIGTLGFGVPEPWFQNDAAELIISLFNGAILNGSISGTNAIVTRVLRRFTDEQEGLVGNRLGIDYPPVDPGGYELWQIVEPEGSKNLGGIETDARPARDYNILSRANGSYVMEFKIPLWGLFFTDPLAAGDNLDILSNIKGKKVKMDFTIFDDDVDSPDLSKVVRSSLSRHLGWWGIHDPIDIVALGPYDAYDWRSSAVFAPVFKFVGSYEESQNLVVGMLPNENEIYGGALQGYLDWFGTGTSLAKSGSNVATHISLNIAPNPMLSSSLFQFSLPGADQVGMRIYNPAGALIMDLGTRNLPSGIHSLRWDGKQANGQKAAKGNYLVRLKTGKKVLTRRLTIIR